MNALLDTLTTPVLSHHFVTLISIAGIPSPIDAFFQRVSGLGHTMEIDSRREGGRNTGNIHLPLHVSNSNLVLERGVMMLSPLTLSFSHVMRSFGMVRMNVVVMLLNDKSIPFCTWSFRNALPVSWQVGDLDAGSSKVLVNRLEMAYEDVSCSGIKS